jgi:hypothetical protein
MNEPEHIFFLLAIISQGPILIAENYNRNFHETGTLFFKFE